MTDLSRWSGRVALVTGASSGIGRAVAERLASGGLRLAVCARRTERLTALADQIGSGGAEVVPIRCDMRREEQIEAMFRTVRDRWGGVDVLVNNAGLGHEAPLLSGATDHWREMLEVNVLALSICTREAVSDMRRRGDDGHVIHLSSMAAHRVPLGSGVYSATKFAVRSLTEGLRAELRAAQSNVRVTAISPGFVETEFAEKFHRSRERAIETYGRYRTIQPEDVAETVAHVLSAPSHVQYHDVLMRPTHQEG